MSELSSLRNLPQSIIARGFGVLMVLSATLAQAATTTVAIGFDTDNNAGTGCALTVGSNSLPGVEVALFTVVTTTANTGTVGPITRRSCVAGTLGAPVTVSAGGWGVGMAAGLNGSDLIETFVPLADLGGAATAKIGAITASDSLVASSVISLQVPPPVTSLPIPALSPRALVLLLILVGGSGWLMRRYARRGGHLLVVLCVGTLALTTASALAIIFDGDGTDWTGIAPLATDPVGDAPAGEDLVALYAVKDGANLALRVDMVLARDPSNQPPVVNAGINQTITLPATAMLTGSATDDGLPNPPGMVTYAWTKFSGPGTVTFGNAASAVTAASFSVAGTYVLRLTASDSALSGSANVTVIVNAAGVGNQPPVVNAGTNQTITLPATATLAGTATDDGLPNPPGALATMWSLVSGPGSGVVFGNPAMPATSATFAAPGTYVLRLTANDGALSASSDMQVTVNDGAPLLLSVANRTIAFGTRFQQLLVARDGNVNDTLTYSLLTAPAGAALSPSPLIDWTPTAAQIGANTFTAKVTDTAGNTAQTTFVVTVVRTNQPPQLAAQPNVILPVGTPFSRTLQATDPDAGDILTFALVSGPSGMTRTGATLNWPTVGRAAGDYPVTVSVTDAGGLSDSKQFTVTLTPAAPPQVPPVAKDDSYSVKVGRTLTVLPAGVLANDIDANGDALTATRLTNLGVGTLTAFNGNGSFTYQAPATPPGAPFTTAKLWSAGAGSDRFHELVADLNGDGYPDIISFDNNAGIRARSGLDGSQLWSADRTGATDCALNSGAGSMDSRVLADIDDSGRPSLAQTTYCSREGSNWHDNIIAFDYLGKVKWVSPPLSKPHPDIRRGATPVPPGGFTPGGLAYGRGLSVARLSAGGAPVLLMRAEIPVNYGYTYYVDAANVDHYAGCRAVTGLVADENVACRATFIISGTDGTVLQTLVKRNPAALARYGGPNALSEMPPIAMDINGDGRVDLVSGTEVWMQNASGGFDFAWQLTTSVSDTAVADLDGDGKAEIIHLRSSGEPIIDNRGIFVYSFDGQLKRRIPLQTYWFTPLTIADVDGDGRSDIVLGADGTVYAFRDDGRPIWAYKVPEDIPDNPVFAPYYTQPVQSSRVANAAPQVYDLDGDGVAEVVFAAHSRIVILDGRTGLRKVAPYWTYNFSYHDISALMLIDMNNDGHIDIVQNAGFNFNCGFVGADFLTECINLIGPTVLRGGGSNNWLPGPKAFPHVQYRSTAIDSKSRVLHDTKVSRVFRTPEQQGTVRDPRLAQGTSFTYAANDGTASSAPATVFIGIVPDNQPPVFTSTPPTSLLQRFAPTPPGGLVTNYYDVAAYDPDPGDTITFSLKSAPDWVTMSGPARIRFEPTCGSYGYPCPWGQTTVIVTATDSRGASTDQIFIVNLTTDSRTVPNVVGLQFEAAKTALIAQDLQGVKWVETFAAQPAGTVLAQDAVAGAIVGRFDDIRLTISKGRQPAVVPFVVGKTLTMANSQLAALGFTVAVNTAFSTTIPVSQVMAQAPDAGTTLLPIPANPVALTVSAGPPLAGTVAQIIVEPGATLRLVGDDQPYKATAVFTDGTSADVTLSATWFSTVTSVATVNATGTARGVANGATVLRATLGAVSGQTTLNIATRALSDSVPPTAIIVAPANGSAVTGSTPVTGTATDANFLRYELAIAAAGDAAWTLIGEGTAPVTNGALGNFDPTTLVNDLYTLRLTVFDRGGNQNVATTTVQVSGNWKVGLFSLTYQDLNIPAAGIPLTIHRTYDSRDKTQGDFGIGWRLGLQTLRLRTNRVLGTGWVRTVSGASVSLAPTSEHKVSLTLPDGRIEEFDMKVSPTSNIGSLDATNVTGFQARPGTEGQLQALANNGLLIVNGGAEEELLDDTTLDTYSPKLYRYTTSEGTQYEISPTEGVKKLTDRYGNAVSFGPGGILHSNGTGIVFGRDFKGRIVQITDLLGNAQTYAYDGNGDLVTHTNLTGAVSRFAYDRKHGLIEVRDALGTRVARNDYDASGRLIAMTDADGKQITFANNTGAQEELVTDRLGSQSRVVYDAQGNVISQERNVTIDGVLVNAVTTTAYDTQGNETSGVDPDGLRTASTYSGLLPLTRTVDPAGLNLKTTIAYNARDDVTNATDPDGRVFSFSYDAIGNLTGFVMPDTGPATVVSNAQGMPIQRRDALGNNTVLTRDAAGHVTREEAFDAAAVLLRRVDFTYDANGNKTSQTLYRTVGAALMPLTTRYAYDAANRLVATTDALGSVARTEYDANAKVTAEIDPLGRRRSYSYDSLGRRTRATFADGTFETSTYDAEGNVLATTDRAGRMTASAYDELKRPVKTTLPDGSSTRTIYSPGGRIAATIDRKGNRTDFAYDSAGRRTSTTLPAVVNGAGGPAVRPLVANALNGRGAPLSATDPNGRVTTYAYDAAGRQTRTTFADGSTIAHTFDALGRRTSTSNEEGQITTFGYDGLGRLVSVSGLAGNASYTYDEAGNLVTQTDALGRTTRFRYDALNRLSERQYPGGETEKFAYDATGNLVSRTDGLGRLTTFAYDVLNRPTGKMLPGGVAIGYTYQPDGQRATVSDPRGTTIYAYDSVGRLSSVTHPTGGTVSYTRDASDNLLTLASPAATVSYGYDALNRLVQVNAPEGQSQTFYDLAGNRVRQSAANGIVTDAIFDARNRPVQLTHRAGGGAVLQSYASAYSQAGRRTSITEFDGSVEAYSYDAKGRLASEVRTGTNSYNQSHTYDAAGNRVQTVRNGTPTTFGYDSNDRLLSDGTAAYAWDANGNLVSKTLGATMTQYGYSAENRLVSILGGGLANQYAYDDDGNRVQASTAIGTTRFLVDSANNTGLSQVLEEKDGSGTLRARYSYGSRMLAMASGGTPSFPLRDALGNTRALSDTAGAITDRYQFDAFGNEVSATGSTVNPYRYRGERFDADSGLYQLRARYYNPAQGRFLSRDPVAGQPRSPLSRHRYLYANSDPVDYVDPTGRESLIGISFAQAINNMIDEAFFFGTAIVQGCNLKQRLDVVGQTILWGGISAAALTYFTQNESFRGAKAFAVAGINPVALGNDLKSLALILESRPFNLKINSITANGRYAYLAIGSEGLNGGVGVPIREYPFGACGIPIGNVALKGGLASATNLDEGEGKFVLFAELDALGVFFIQYPILDLILSGKGFERKLLGE